MRIDILWLLTEGAQANLRRVDKAFIFAQLIISTASVKPVQRVQDGRHYSDTANYKTRSSRTQPTSTIPVFRRHVCLEDAVARGAPIV